MGKRKQATAIAPIQTPPDRIYSLVRIDHELLAMIREAIATVHATFPDHYDVATWDRPWDSSWYPDYRRYETPAIFREGNAALLGEFCQAVGFIAGCAATFDVTPCELIDHVVHLRT